MTKKELKRQITDNDSKMYEYALAYKPDDDRDEYIARIINFIRHGNEMKTRLNNWGKE